MDMEKANADFLKTKVSWAVIVKTDLATVERIKKLLADMPEVFVCFQKMSLGHLWIIDKPEEGRS